MIRICAYTADGKFRRDIPVQELARLLDDPDSKVWVDMLEPTDFENEILATMFGLHPLSIEDCVAEIHHPKLDDYGDYIYIILHWVDRGPEGLMSEDLDTFVSRNFLVTYRKSTMACVDELMSNQDRTEDAMSRGLDYLLYVIHSGLVAHYYPILDTFEREIDLIEDEIFEHAESSILGRIQSLKRSLLSLRRLAGPQREIFANLSRGNSKFIDQEARLHFRDIYDAFYRVIDTSDLYKDLVNGAMETYLSVASHRLNEVMKFLTILSTLMLPPTLIAGIYGMNFEFMPELKWKYGYVFVLGLILTTITVLLAFFRRKKWL